MHDTHDLQDAQLDRNLRLVGERLRLPAEPSTREQSAWKTAAARPGALPDSATSRAPLVRLHPRRLWAFAGSAAAAAILFAVFLLNLVQPPRVEAAMILRSFQEAAHRGFRVTIENIDIEGIRAEGQVRMQFPAPVNLAQMLHDPAAVPDPEWFTLDMTVRAAADAGDLAGLDLRIAGAFTDDTRWAYLKAAHLPNEVMADIPAPIAGWIAGFLDDGVLLDLTGLDAQGLFGGSDDTPDDPPNPPSGSVPGTMLRFQVSNADDAGADFAVSALPSAPRNGLTLRFSTDDDTSAATGDPDASAEQALLALLAGQAGREQLDEIVSLLTSASADGHVAEVGPGVFELTITDFGGSDPLLASAALHITYRELAGIEALALLNVGPSNGSIRLEFREDLTLDDPTLLDRNRVLEPGVTRIIDAATIQAFAGMFSGG